MSSLWRIEQSSVRVLGKPDSLLWDKDWLYRLGHLGRVSLVERKYSGTFGILGKAPAGRQLDRSPGLGRGGRTRWPQKSEKRHIKAGSAEGGGVEIGLRFYITLNNPILFSLFCFLWGI